jgi:hypothetical protein
MQVVRSHIRVNKPFEQATQRRRLLLGHPVQVPGGDATA